MTKELIEKKQLEHDLQLLKIELSQVRILSLTTKHLRYQLTGLVFVLSCSIFVRPPV